MDYQVHGIEKAVTYRSGHIYFALTIKHFFPRIFVLCTTATTIIIIIRNYTFVCSIHFGYLPKFEQLTIAMKDQCGIKN